MKLESPNQIGIKELILSDSKQRATKIPIRLSKKS